MVSYKMESNTFSKIYILEAKEGFPKKIKTKQIIQTNNYLYC